VTEEERVREYTKAVGHPPVWKDDPDWLYTGSKEELEALKVRLGLVEEPEAIDGQMELV
jgi:hypothetical protein